MSEIDSLYARIRDLLRLLIIEGQLVGGDLLLETPLARRLGVSRPPVRQALRLLVAEGLVTKAKGQGYLVAARADEATEAAAESPFRRRRIDIEALEFPLDKGERLERAPALWRRIDQIVEREIAARIVFGRYRIVESRLGEAYGVSRTVARDVLRRIEKLGLVAQSDRGHWLAGPLTPQAVSDHYAVRRLLEPAALEASAARLRRNDLLRYHERLKHCIGRYPDLSAAEMSELEMDLHGRCVLATPNRQMAKILQLSHLLLISNTYLLSVYRKLPSEEPFMGEHLEIFDALLAGKPAQAATRLRLHLKEAEAKSILRLLTVRQESERPADLVWMPAEDRD